MTDWQTQAITNGALAILLMVAFVAVFLLAIKTRSILDRYRIKYGFDREIESKEIDNIKHLDRREQAFKRRTFRDMENKP